MFTQKFNEITQQQEVLFPAKCLSIGTKVLENVNGTRYYVAIIEFTNVDGVVTKSTAFIYENNLISKETGETQIFANDGVEYQATAALTKQGTPYITLSQLQSVSFAAADNFGFTKPKEEVQEFKNAPAVEEVAVL